MPTTSERQPADPALVQPLPRGRHNIPPELIAADQRRRLFAAIAATTAARGFATVTIADVTTAARVSRATFYELFESKEQCLLAAHQAYGAALLAAIDRACAEHDDRQHKLAAALHAALAFLAFDLAAAQLLILDILALGPRGAQSYHALLDALLVRLRAWAHRSFSDDADWAAIAYLSARVARAASENDPDAIFACEDGFAALLLAIPREASAR